jgi:Chaperone of endosialidase
MKTITKFIYLTLTGLALACFALSSTSQAQDDPETDGNNNSAMEGSSALASLTTGIENTGLGFEALFSNTTGNDNTATGLQALFSNTAGVNNTATGLQALFSNTTGLDNTATGAFALFSNDGIYNTATGAVALSSNTTGDDNTATGNAALAANTHGADNTATGGFALVSNTTGFDNTATGVDALGNNTTGASNIAIGFQAGLKLTTGSSNIDIGNLGVAGESKTIRVGTSGIQTKTFIAGISGATVARGAGVIVGTNGQLGTVVSSERFKDAIKPMDKASEAILALKPVTFRYKHELDPDGIRQFGLVAEDVAKVNPDLVVRDAEGKVYSVRYEAVNAMLLNEFLKAHRRIEEQDKRIDELTAQLKQQAALIQKVNDKVELTKPAPQTVSNRN